MAPRGRPRKYATVLECRQARLNSQRRYNEKRKKLRSHIPIINTANKTSVSECMPENTDNAPHDQTFEVPETIPESRPSYEHSLGPHVTVRNSSSRILDITEEPISRAVSFIPETAHRSLCTSSIISSRNRICSPGPPMDSPRVQYPYSIQRYLKTSSTDNGQGEGDSQLTVHCGLLGGQIRSSASHSSGLDHRSASVAHHTISDSALSSVDLVESIQQLPQVIFIGSSVPEQSRSSQYSYRPPSVEPGSHENSSSSSRMYYFNKSLSNNSVEPSFPSGSTPLASSSGASNISFISESDIEYDPGSIQSSDASTDSATAWEQDINQLATILVAMMLQPRTCTQHVAHEATGTHDSSTPNVQQVPCQHSETLKVRPTASESLHAALKEIPFVLADNCFSVKGVAPLRAGVADLLYAGVRPDNNVPESISFSLHERATSTKVAPTYTFDIDSILCLPTNLGFAKKGIKMCLTPMRQKNISSNLHIRIPLPRSLPKTSRLSATLREIPQIEIGHLYGQEEHQIHILFPNMLDGTRISNYLTKNEIERFIDEVFLYAVHQHCPPSTVQHIPGSYQSTKLRSTAAVREQGVRQASDNPRTKSFHYALAPDHLYHIWQTILDRVQMPGLQDFLAPIIFLNSKNLKLGTSFKEPLTTLKSFQRYWTELCDMTFIPDDHLWVDFACEVIHDARMYVPHLEGSQYPPSGWISDEFFFFWRKCCLKSIATHFMQHFPNQRCEVHYYNLLLSYELANMTMEPSRTHTARNLGLAYSQFYSTSKEIFDAAKVYPFDNAGLEVLAADEHLRQMWHEVAQKGTYNLSHLGKAYLSSRRRAIEGLLGASNHSFGIRQEHRIQYPLLVAMQNILESATQEPVVEPLQQNFYHTKSKSQCEGLGLAQVMESRGYAFLPVKFVDWVQGRIPRKLVDDYLLTRPHIKSLYRKRVTEVEATHDLYQQFNHAIDNMQEHAGNPAFLTVTCEILSCVLIEIFRQEVWKKLITDKFSIPQNLRHLVKPDAPLCMPYLLDLTAGKLGEFKFVQNYNRHTFHPFERVTYLWDYDARRKRSGWARKQWRILFQLTCERLTDLFPDYDFVHSFRNAHFKRFLTHNLVFPQPVNGSLHTKYRNTNGHQQRSWYCAYNTQESFLWESHDWTTGSANNTCYNATIPPPLHFTQQSLTSLLDSVVFTT
ncbi:hypothetical protein HOY80DRAFT_1099023 [Tuber brumale]|nr:hypothetical protein HOY80DRAFT_1099023 [Tuber brumale]